MIFIIGLVLIFGVCLLLMSKPEQSEQEKEYSKAKKSIYWDEVSWRILLPDFEILKLKFKHISRDEYFELVTKFNFTPVRLYVNKVKTEQLEAGHDLEYRYLIDFKKEVNS